MTPNYLLINGLNHEPSKADYIRCETSEATSPATPAGKWSLLLSIPAGKVEAHDYTSQIIDKVKAIA